VHEWPRVARDEGETGTAAKPARSGVSYLVARKRNATAPADRLEPRDVTMGPSTFTLRTERCS
jgi:hypothetical protein